MSSKSTSSDGSRVRSRTAKEGDAATAAVGGPRGRKRSGGADRDGESAARSAEGKARKSDEAREPEGSRQGSGGSERRDWRKPQKRRGSARRGGRKRRQGGPPPADGGAGGPAADERSAKQDDQDGRSPREAEGARDLGRESTRPSTPQNGRAEGARNPQAGFGPGPNPNKRPGRRARRRAQQAQTGFGGGNQVHRGAPVHGSHGTGHGQGHGTGAPAHGGKARPSDRHEGGPPRGVTVGEGMLILEHANHGHLRRAENQFLSRSDDIHVSPRLVQKLGLRDGSILTGNVVRGHGRNKYELARVETVDGRTPQEMRARPLFKNLTTIDPDYHYAVGDASGDTSLRVVDLICPVGRGQRGLIVAPPRSGKTILLQKFARAMEAHYPEVHLMVLLVDERPEEATEWRRTIERGQVFVSTNDEKVQTHVDLAEAVWMRCRRLVELGEDVFLVIDSITRLARAYNNLQGPGGRTMSGGIDTRTMDRPKQFFGSARNTESAGSLTILGTTLIETGSRMDQVIFEEFKGTGNMELVLSRKLADRRIFPAIDIQRSGTRKEEKLFSTQKLKLVNTLRRVLGRMHFIEAMELLIAKLEDYPTTDDFLKRFELDPEA